jgi:hypothetical protein
MRYRITNLIRGPRLDTRFMKHPTEKPSEGVMRFFTPELYVQFNSPDEAEADRADEAWEAAIRSYRQHLDDIRDRLPSQVRELAGLCLHDAELLACSPHQDMAIPPHPAWPASFWSVLAVLSLQQDQTITNLIYMLWDGIRVYAPRPDWPFSKERKHWLYDEVDVAADARGAFLHRILFSDGSVMEVPFLTVVVHRFAWRQSDSEAGARRSA